MGWTVGDSYDTIDVCKDIYIYMCLPGTFDIIFCICISIVYICIRSVHSLQLPSIAHHGVHFACLLAQPLASWPPTKEADFFFVPHYTSCLINHADTFAGCDTKQLCGPTTELFQQVLSSSPHYRRMDGGAVDVLGMPSGKKVIIFIEGIRESVCNGL